MSRRPVAFIDASVPASSVARAYYEHDETERWPGMFNFSAQAPAYLAYFTKKRRGEVADKDTQTELQPSSRPGRLLMLDNMTVYELKTIAKDYGIQTTGVKAILIARTERFLAPTF